MKKDNAKVLKEKLNSFRIILFKIDHLNAFLEKKKKEKEKEELKMKKESIVKRGKFQNSQKNKPKEIYLNSSPMSLNKKGVTKGRTEE